MSDTPKTDQFEEAYFEDSTSHVDDVFEYARKLERENAALRADRNRLDWLLSNNGGTWVYWAIDGGQWTPEQGASRSAIDAARKETKP